MTHDRPRPGQRHRGSQGTRPRDAGRPGAASGRLAAGLRDLSLAEEVLQEAAVSALAHWGRAGLPASPAGWLLAGGAAQGHRPAARAARDSRKARRWPLAEDEAAPEPETIPDERLRLIFACCHPRWSRSRAWR
jgi:predicted RNA polymerase sigma factor